VWSSDSRLGVIIALALLSSAALTLLGLGALLALQRETRPPGLS